MQTITKTYNVYKFSELSEDAKQKALEAMYDINIDYDWWNYVYEDAENIGLKITEFDLDRASFVHADTILSYTEIADRIIAEHGETCETYQTAKEFLNDRDNLVAKYSDGVKLDEVTEENEYDFDQDCDNLEEEFHKSLCEDYRIMLQNEYEYLTSEEAIIETIEGNDYDFTEDGELT